MDKSFDLFCPVQVTFLVALGCIGPVFTEVEQTALWGFGRHLSINGLDLVVTLDVFLLLDHLLLAFGSDELLKLK